MNKLLLTKIILALVVVAAVIAAMVLIAKNGGSILSPIYAPGKQTKTIKKEVMGFLPYWNLKTANELDLSALSTIYYFAVDINPDGSFNTADPGWTNLNSPEVKNLRFKILNSGKRWGLTIVNLDQDSIARNVNNADRRENLVENTVRLMKDEGFQDLNIDLEYIGVPDDGLTKNFTALVSDMTDRVHREIPGSKVSLDGFADSIAKPKIFDMRTIGQTVDFVVIMAYDIHRLNSIAAGPIAPLLGKGKYEYDVTTAVNEYSSVVPTEKILLGVPFYGYEWPTEDNTKGAFVIGSYIGPEISSYHRSVQTAADHNASINFDDESGSVWFSYFATESGSWRQVWFENERSMGLKLNLVNKAKLGGVAIFALGYDGATAAPLWRVIRELLVAS